MELPVPVTGELVPSVLVPREGVPVPREGVPVPGEGVLVPGEVVLEPGEVVLAPVNDVLEPGEVLVPAADLVLAPGVVDGDGVGEDSRIRLLGEFRLFLFRFLAFELS